MAATPQAELEAAVKKYAQATGGVVACFLLGDATGDGKLDVAAVGAAKLPVFGVQSVSLPAINVPVEQVLALGKPLLAAVLPAGAAGVTGALGALLAKVAR